MRKHILNAFLVFCMALGSAVFPIRASAAVNGPIYIQIASADLSKVMDMKVIDSSGKSVKLRDLVAKNKVTMLNFWGTFCAPCTKEMPILETLGKKYADQGFKVIGLCVDVVDSKGKFDPEEKELAEEIVSDTGVTYPIVYPLPKVKESLGLVTFPTTYFVDSKGNAMEDALYGARDSATWEKEIKSCLKKVNG